jgi:hypothetical protein
MQLHAAQPCHSAIHLAVGGLRLLGRPETRPDHITVRAGSASLCTTGQVLYFVFGPMIKCHSDSTGPLASGPPQAG